MVLSKGEILLVVEADEDLVLSLVGFLNYLSRGTALEDAGKVFHRR